MPPPTPNRGSLPARLLRYVLILAALGLSFLIYRDYRSWHSESQEVLELARELGLLEVDSKLEHAITSDPDAVMARLEVAKALVAEVLDPANQERFAGLEGRAEAIARLEKARDLAAQVRERRPTVWDAPMVQGGATYLAWSVGRDPRLVREYRAWEAPLERALELSPGSEEPHQFLAAAYLELWDVLSEAKRERTRELLREALQDATFFSRLVGPWLQTADTREEAYDLLPDTPATWKALQDRYLRSQDWEAYVDARDRQWAALQRDFTSKIDEAEKRLAGGDLRGGRGLLSGVISAAPPSGAFEPIFQRAMALLPPGPLSGRLATPLQSWLHWNLERCLYTGCRLETKVASRIRGSLLDPEPWLAARAALAASDLVQAERAERSDAGSWREEWSPYLLQKADLHRQRGEPADAKAALENVHRRWKERPVYTIRKERTAKPEAPSAASLPQDRWDATDWRGRTPFIELLATTEAQALAITLDVVPTEGGLIEIWWDGDRLQSASVEAGQTLELPVPVEPGLHHLELRTLSRKKILPGNVALVP